MAKALDGEAGKAKSARTILLTLSAGHLSVDLNAGAAVALLPLLEGPFHVSVGALTLIVAIVECISSIIQPIFGAMVDRSARPWVMPVGIATAALGMAAIGLMPTYGLVVVVAAVMAIGNAMYHPEGSRTAYLTGGPRRASSMSIFSVGGNVGYASGPLFLAVVSALFGLGGTLAFLVPGAFAVILFLAVRPGIAPAKPGRSQDQSRASSRPTDRTSVFFVVTYVTLRSALMFSVTALVPLFLVKRFGMDPHLAAAMDFVFLFTGAFGTLLGGPFSDRRGRRFHLLAATALAVPIAFVMPHVGLVGLVATMAVLGFILVSTFATTITLAQELMPASVGMASGLAVGLGVGIGALVILFVGQIADQVGIGQVLSWLFLAPLGAFLAALPLPKGRLQDRLA